MNEFNDLDDLERELGPSVRVALRRAAADITGQARPRHRVGGNGAEPAHGIALLPDPTDLHVLEDEYPGATVVDVRSTRARRTARRPWLIVAAAAAVVVVMAVTAVVQRTGDEGIRTRLPAGPSRSVTTAPTPPTGVPRNPGFDELMFFRGGPPSIPKTGELVASAWRERVGVSYLYADGRLIWLDDVNGTPGWVEQRLTPEGVERVRSEFLSSGLFDPRQGPVGQEPHEYVPELNDEVGCLVCVRDGDRLLSRDVQGLTPEEDLLVDHLATLPSSLPATDWAEQQITPYVPSKYSVCLSASVTRDGVTTRPNTSIALKELPARAVRLLGGRQATREIGSLDPCLAITTGKARALANVLLAARYVVPGHPGPDSKYAFDLETRVNRRNLEGIDVRFTQLLPDGTLAFYYPAKH